jgi:hypothetical protein
LDAIVKNMLGAGGVAQVVEYLPSKSKALSSNSRTAKNNHHQKTKQNNKNTTTTKIKCL